MCVDVARPPLYDDRVIEKESDGRFRARCDQCAADSGVLQATSGAAMRALLRAAGWTFSDSGLAYCVRCGTTPATPSSRKQKRP